MRRILEVIKASWLLSFLAAGPPGCKATWMQGHRDTRQLSNLAARQPGSRAAGQHRSQNGGFHTMEHNKSDHKPRPGIRLVFDQDQSGQITAKKAEEPDSEYNPTCWGRKCEHVAWNPDQEQTWCILSDRAVIEIYHDPGHCMIKYNQLGAGSGPKWFRGSIGMPKYKDWHIKIKTKERPVEKPFKKAS